MNAMRKRGMFAPQKPKQNLDCIPCIDCTAAVPSTGQVMAIMGNLMLESAATQVALPQKKETKMIDERTEVQQQRDYLFDSLRQVVRQKESELMDAFNLRNPHGLETFGDLRKAIKNGWVSLPEEYADTEDKTPLYDNPVYLIKFQNPEKKPDRAGFEKVRAAMFAAQSDTKDQIVVFSPEKGLEALNAFKAQSFH